MQYFDRKGLGFILGDFFINSSGHPDVRLMYLCHVHALTFVSVFVSVTAFVVHRFVFALNSAYIQCGLRVCTKSADGLGDVSGIHK
jgi:hypothetical protein